MSNWTDELVEYYAVRLLKKFASDMGINPDSWIRQRAESRAESGWDLPEKKYRQEILQEVRKRRDEIQSAHPTNLYDRWFGPFWSLFDEGAEFGPDKPEITIDENYDKTRLESLIKDLQEHSCRQHDRIEFLEELNRDLGRRLDEAIKKLGAEESS